MVLTLKESEPFVNLPTKVIDATITINSMPLTNPFSIDIPTGGPGTTVFTSVTGNSIIVAFEYETVSALAIPTGSPTVHCNTSTANSIGTYQSQSTNGTTLSASSFRPETRFGNTLTDPFNVKAVYSYGKLPWEWGFEFDTAVYDNELLPAMVKDKNGFALKRNLAGNFPIVCTISIYNVNGNFKGNTVINFNNLNPYIIKKYNNITYDVANYTARGKVDRVIVQAAKGENSYSISGDGGYTSEKEVCRFVNCDSYNYVDYCSPDDGGIGFNNASGYLAAKFRNYSQNVFPVYAIDHYFFNPSSLGNQPYRIVIFDDDGFEHPGNLIYISSILTSPAGNFSTQEVTHILNSPVNISGESNFYVGINQVSVTNIGAGFQFEDPVRDSAFFFSSTGSLNSWTDFSTDSVNCRMDISPRTARNFSLKAILEGFYNGISMIPDTAEVEIRSADFPYNIIESRKSLLNSSGTGNYYFLNLKDKDTLNVYFVFKHRNHITTWSHSDPENFNECIKTYDFSDSLSKAFGNNMKTNGSVYMIYGGDINQDGLIDGLDLVYADNDAANFSTGYLATDVNGDEIVDAADIVIVDNNAAMFISSISP